jgi:hypothetical protein
MALAPHMKAVVELAALNERTRTLVDRLRKMAPHDAIEAAITAVEGLRGGLSKAHESLTKLPPNYSPHASKMKTADIIVGARVAIREPQRPKYAALLTEAEMESLEVTGVGGSCSVKTAGGVRLLVARGHLVTAAPVQASEGSSDGTAV